MRSKIPTVSIGLPVHNGENFLENALESLLGQTYTDLEIILCDSGSTDRTPQICSDFAQRDDRVRYISFVHDRGAGPNFNRALALARGRYFRWAAHDDEVHPELLGQAVELLERDPSVSLCHCRVRVIDDAGRFVGDRAYGLATDSPNPVHRFHELLFVPNDCYEVFGLIRRSALEGTGRMGCYPVGDRVLLAELAFRGRFHQIPERWFYSREHRGRSVRRLVSQRERAAWFNAYYRDRNPLPEWRVFGEYLRAIERAPLSHLERMRCRVFMVSYLRHYRGRMGRDLVHAVGSTMTGWASSPRRRSSAPFLDTGTVLLFERDERSRALLRRFLEDAGYQVDEAASEESALSMWESERRTIDLVVADAGREPMVPRIVTELRSRRPDLPVLFLAQGQWSAPELDANAEVVCRPLGREEVVEGVRALLKGRGSALQAQPSTGEAAEAWHRSGSEQNSETEGPDDGGSTSGQHERSHPTAAGA